MGMLVSPVVRLTVAVVCAVVAPVSLWGGKRCLMIKSSDNDKSPFEEKVLKYGFVALMTIGMMAGVLFAYSSATLVSALVFEAYAKLGFSTSFQIASGVISGLATGALTLFGFKQVFEAIDVFGIKRREIPINPGYEEM